MGLAWLRRSSRLIAAVVLLASMWQLPHRAQDDEICVPAATEAHDESKHVFTAVADYDHRDHCAICHWLRTLKPAYSAGPVATTGADAGLRLAAPASSSLRDPGTGQLPARAPPSQLN